MSNLSIVVLDGGTLSDEIEFRPPDVPHTMTVYERTAPEEVAARIQDADIVVLNKVAMGPDEIAAAPKLKLIAIAATGHDKIDQAACRAHGVTVSNVREYAVNTVPEHTFALLLALRRSIVPYRASVIAGRWEEAGQFCYFDYPIADLSGATLGVIGDGSLGKRVAKLGEAFGMRVLFSAYKGVDGMGPLYTPFDEVMRVADVITLHCPLMPATRNLISDREFALMERKPLIINTARGGLVDEEALERALEAGAIAGAGFDVVTTEPPGENHVMRRIAARDDVIITPHVAWASREAVQAVADQVTDMIESYVRGTPINVVC
ncbi:D-2-hydroxyacid dehydrogenase [Acuticoccus mangrovi]|uniref:D-2-hydroxyacid dehydrogenase n=1 Tax=Acuticoccus mangrovi TaxID=2796142 RepID=A0A934IQR1_9HYPH|nr:D-2-hydroxyacid dehydrogenase [Acuticoccus mangrovi]MBJ3776976.1 D-2-hydroxyacid dehydrogenase [Acuticoccus mangrovi]